MPRRSGAVGQAPSAGEGSESAWRKIQARTAYATIQPAIATGIIATA